MTSVFGVDGIVDLHLYDPWPFPPIPGRLTFLSSPPGPGDGAIQLRRRLPGGIPSIIHWM